MTLYIVNTLNDFTINPDNAIITKKQNEIAEQISSLSSHETDLKQQNETLIQQSNDFQFQITELKKKQLTLNDELIKSIQTIHLIHDYICTIRNNIRIYCRIDINKALPPLNADLKYVYLNETPFPVQLPSSFHKSFHAISFDTTYDNQFYFDKIFPYTDTQHEQIHNEIIAKSKNVSKETFNVMNVNLTVINIDIVSIENNIFVQKYLLHYIQYLIQTLHYKEVTCTCGAVNKVVKSFSINANNINEVINSLLEGIKLINESDSNNVSNNNDAVIIQIKNDNCGVFTYVHLHPEYIQDKTNNTILKIIAMHSNKKTNKNQIPFKDSKLTSYLKNYLRNTDKIILLTSLIENDITYKETYMNIVSLLKTNNIIF
jgi:hypothetical protein